MVSTASFQHKEVLGLKFGYSPIGRPNLWVHIYFVDGLLIDTGQRKVAKQLIQATKTLNIEQILLTHFHEDHTGNVEQLQQQHKCRVYASEKTCQIMKDPPKISLAQKLVWGERAPYHSLTPIQDRIATKNFQFEIIPIPGHAPDMVALYEPDKKWLFSADLFINTYIGYFIDDESIKEQIDSIKRILKLDFEVMFCAHNPQLTASKERLAQKLRFLESFFDDVATLRYRGYSEKKIFKVLKLKENRFVKALSGGRLSKLNMVRSVIRDLERTP